MGHHSCREGGRGWFHDSPPVPSRAARRRSFSAMSGLVARAVEAERRRTRATTHRRRSRLARHGGRSRRPPLPTHDISAAPAGPYRRANPRDEAHAAAHPQPRRGRCGPGLEERDDAETKFWLDHRQEYAIRRREEAGTPLNVSPTARRLRQRSTGTAGPANETNESSLVGAHLNSYSQAALERLSTFHTHASRHPSPFQPRLRLEPHSNTGEAPQQHVRRRDQTACPMQPTSNYNRRSSCTPATDPGLRRDGSRAGWP